MTFDPANLSTEKMHEWEVYSRGLETELRQCLDEGKDVSRYADLCAAIAALPLGPMREELADVFFRAVDGMPLRPDYPYCEPDDLDAIRAARPAEAVSLPPRVNETDYRDTVYGAWADTIGGCAPADDDTNYTVMAALGIVEKYGRGFTSDDVARAWVDLQPKRAYCTAERRAFRNFVIGITPPRSATYKNPDREFIGAQIRGDYFGYINPGDPETAADMAWRDARVSHVKNGVYGEMFVAAMLAAAAVTDDLRLVVEAGLGQIPANSRLSEGIRRVTADYDAGLSEEQCFARIADRWDEHKAYDWVHTISNAEIVTASLLYGNLDYEHSICRAVQTGFDTDCNGATVGSIVGMIIGARALPAAWTDIVGDSLNTAIFGVGRVRISDLADLTLRHANI